MKSPPEYADIIWKETDVPYSEEFKDIYYSPESGYNETLHVFIDGNLLGERFRNCHDYFIIAETGFGTGLNFAVARYVFLKNADPESRLIFYSCEKRPVRNADRKRALDAVLKNTEVMYDDMELPPPSPGWQLHLFDEGRTELRIFYGDVSGYLTDLNSWKKDFADAWFPDGFAPSRNEAMWERNILESIVHLTKPGGTLATFTVSASVRKALEDAGMQCEKIPGYGRKKEMLRAVKKKPAVNPGADRITENQSGESGGIYDAVIIGAGIAGVSAAFSLARRNKKTLLLEKEKEPALHGSGNPAGIVFPFVTAQPDFISRMLVTGFYYIKNIIKLFKYSGMEPDHGECGVLQLYHDERQKTRLEKALKNMGYHPETFRYSSCEEAQELSGVSVKKEAVFFGDSFWIRPGELVNSFLKFIQLKKNNYFTFLAQAEALKITKVHHSVSGSGGILWETQTEITDATGKKEKRAFLSRSVIVAASYGSAALIRDFSEAELAKNRGQIAVIPSDERSSRLKCVLCYDGYMIPSVNGEHVIGTTYEKNTEGYETDAETLGMLVRKAEEITGLSLLREGMILKGRAAYRSTTPDHLPAAGPVTDGNLLEKESGYYRKLTDQKINELRKEGRPADCGNDLTELIPAAEGLYLHAGHGSRGLSYAPLLSEVIAARICGEIPALPADLAAAADPRRYASRRLRRTAGRMKTEQKENQ